MICLSVILYNIGVQAYGRLVRMYAPFNAKAKLWVKGQDSVFVTLPKQRDISGNTIWFHFASLGEFEQGRPIIEAIYEQYPNKKIWVTFFSPSGYEVRKNYELATGVSYLPLDSAANAKKFIDSLNPSLAIFTKYEFWYHYFNELHSRNIPLLMVSTIFRDNQPFFAWYGALHRKMLGCVQHFFVQNATSEKLLQSVGINNCSVAGDTRFDRVVARSKQAFNDKIIEAFHNKSNTVVCGSTWPQDIEVLLPEIAQKNKKWLIAPHEINVDAISKLLTQLGTANCNVAVYSQANESEATKADILVIDTIGMLSALYRFGNIAYVGGGFGKGIHNTLEAAVYGVPVIFGPNYQRFAEAVDMIELQVAFTLDENNTLAMILKKIQVTDRLVFNEKLASYFQQNIGATDTVIDYIEQQNLA